MGIDPNIQQIGIRQVVEGTAKFKQDMDAYNATLGKSDNKTEKFSSSVTKQSKKAGSSLTNFSKTAKTALKATGVVLGAAAIVGALKQIIGAAVEFGKEAVEVSTRAEEMESKFDAVFRDSAPRVIKAFTDFAEAANRSKLDLMEMSSTVQDTFVPLGFARDKAADLSVSLTKLAVDVASFNDKLETDVMRDFQSALVGNTETVRKYGIIITQTVLDQELLRMEVLGGIEAATEQQKVMARLNLIMEGTKDAHGDAIRTSDSLENVTKGLTAAMKDLRKEVGDRLAPSVKKYREVMTKVVKGMNLFFTAQNALNDAVDAGVISGDKALEEMRLMQMGYRLAEDVIKEYSGTLEEATVNLDDHTYASGEAGIALGQYKKIVMETERALKEQATATVENKEVTDLLKDALDAGALSQYEYELAMLRSKEGTLDLTEAQRNQMQATIDSKEAAEEQIEAGELMAENLRNQREAAKGAALALSELAEQYSDTEDLDAGALAIAALTEQIENATGPTDILEQELNDLKLRYGEVTEFGLAAAEAEALLGEAMLQGIIPAENAEEAWGSFADQINEGIIPSIPEVIDQFGNLDEPVGTQISSLEELTGWWKTVKDDGIDAVGDALNTITTKDSPNVETALKNTATVLETQVAPKFDTFKDETVGGLKGAFKKLAEQAGAAATAILGVGTALENIDGMSATVYLNKITTSDDGGEEDCFLPDTLVNTPYGEKEIASIFIGDEIWVYDDGDIHIAKVLQTILATRNDLVMVITDNKTVVCSPNHRFLTDEGWIEASGLQGMEIITHDNTSIECCLVSPYIGRHAVYNLEVDHEAHTYLVSGMVVHNKKDFARGVDMIIPPGYPNDSFGPIMVESGERLLVIPRSEVAAQNSYSQRSTTNNTQSIENSPVYNISVDAGGMDGDEAVEVVRQAIQEVEFEAGR